MTRAAPVNHGLKGTMDAPKAAAPSPMPPRARGRQQNQVSATPSADNPAPSPNFRLRFSTTFMPRVLRLPSPSGEFRQRASPPCPARHRQVEHHGAGVAIGLFATRETLRELAAERLDLGELLIDGCDPLSEEARHAPALTRCPE